MKRLARPRLLSGAGLTALALLLAGCSYDFDGFSGDAGAQDGARPADGGVDAGPGDAALDVGSDACTAQCTSTARGCTSACQQTLATCNAQCASGNPGKACRTQCQQQETQCVQGCASDCNTCTSQAGCSDPAACTLATQ